MRPSPPKSYSASRMRVPWRSRRPPGSCSWPAVADGPGCGCPGIGIDAQQGTGPSSSRSNRSSSGSGIAERARGQMTGCRYRRSSLARGLPALAFPGGTCSRGWRCLRCWKTCPRDARSARSNIRMATDSRGLFGDSCTIVPRPHRIHFTGHRGWHPKRLSPCSRARPRRPDVAYGFYMLAECILAPALRKAFSSAVATRNGSPESSAARAISPAIRSAGEVDRPALRIRM